MRSNTIGHSDCDGTQASSLFVAKMALRVDAHKSQSGEYVMVYVITSIERTGGNIRQLNGLKFSNAKDQRYGISQKIPNTSSCKKTIDKQMFGFNQHTVTDPKFLQVQGTKYMYKVQVQSTQTKTKV